jgi:hypothetical protein
MRLRNLTRRPERFLSQDKVTYGHFNIVEAMLSIVFGSFGSKLKPQSPGNVQHRSSTWEQGQ